MFNIFICNYFYSEHFFCGINDFNGYLAENTEITSPAMLLDHLSDDERNQLLSVIGHTEGNHAPTMPAHYTDVTANFSLKNLIIAVTGRRCRS